MNTNTLPQMSQSAGIAGQNIWFVDPQTAGLGGMAMGGQTASVGVPLGVGVLPAGFDMSSSAALEFSGASASAPQPQQAVQQPAAVQQQPQQQQQQSHTGAATTTGANGNRTAIHTIVRTAPGVIGMEINTPGTNDLKLIGLRPGSLGEQQGLKKYIGWTLTQVDQKPCSSSDDVLATENNPTTYLTFTEGEPAQQTAAQVQQLQQTQQLQLQQQQLQQQQLLLQQQQQQQPQQQILLPQPIIDTRYQDNRVLAVPPYGTTLEYGAAGQVGYAVPLQMAGGQVPAMTAAGQFVAPAGQQTVTAAVPATAMPMQQPLQQMQPQLQQQHQLLQQQQLQQQQQQQQLQQQQQQQQPTTITGTAPTTAALRHPPLQVPTVPLKDNVASATTTTPQAEVVYTGKVKSYHATQGFGFIKCDDLMATHKRDIFLHKSQAVGLHVGQEVTFSLDFNKKGWPQARNVQGIE